MQRESILFLNTTPYSFENTYSLLKIADAGLKKGWKVRLIASNDGVFCRSRRGRI